MYCPSLPPLDAPDSRDCSKWEEYDRENLPIRNNQKFRFDATHIEETGHKEAADHTGIAGLAILARLRSIDFPRSFPPDSMHLFFENVIPAMVRHYRGIFFKKDCTPEGETATNNNHEQPARSGDSGRRRRSTHNSHSGSAQGVSSRTDSGVGPGTATSKRRQLQKPGNQKFKKTSDPWNVDPKVWERIGHDQKVCIDTSWSHILLPVAYIYNSDSYGCTIRP